MAAAYELVAVARTPQAATGPTLTVLGPIVAPSITWTDELVGPGSIAFSCEARLLQSDIRARLRDLDANPTEVRLYRDGVVVAAGFLAGYQLQGGTLSATAPGLLGYLAYMWLTSDLSYAGVDQHTIGKGLVDHWQALSYGNFGIDTSGITASGVTRVRDFKALEGEQVLRRLLELRAVDDGFDVHVNPATRALVFSYPQRGTDLSASVIFDQRNIVDDGLSVSVAPGDLASEALTVGTGPAAAPIASSPANTALRAAFGRTGVWATFDGVSVQATLDDHAQALLDARDAQLVVPSPGLVPIADVDVDGFNVGDTVKYSFDAGLGLVEATRRVTTRRVTIDEAGKETMAVALS